MTEIRIIVGNLLVNYQIKTPECVVVLLTTITTVKHVLTHSGPAGAQLQQKALEAAAGAGRHSWEPEPLHSGPQRGPWATLEHTNWGGTH